MHKKFKFKEGKSEKTPTTTTTKLHKYEKGKFMDIKTYRGMIESLLYLTARRPTIMFSVCLCARFQDCPKESHLHVVKTILKYLLGTIDVRLWYPTLQENMYFFMHNTDVGRKSFSRCRTSFVEKG